MKILYLILLIILPIYYSIIKYTNIFSIVFSSMLIIYFFISIIYKSKYKINKKNIIISIIISIILIIFTIPNFIYKSSNKYITIKNISSVPITIEGIYKNGNLVKTNHSYNKLYDLINDASLITEYKIYNKLDSSYKLTLKRNEEYIINCNKIDNIEIDFQRQKDKYNILINNRLKVIDSYKYDKNVKINKIYDSSYKYKLNNTKFDNNILKNILIFLSLLFIYFGISISTLCDRKKFIMLLFILVIELNNIINISLFTKLIITILVTLFLRLKLNNKSDKNKLLYLIGSIIISISFIGDRLINDKINLLLIMLLCVFVLLIYLLFLYIISFIDYIKSSNNNKIKNITMHRIIVFLLTLGICIFYAYIFYPFIVHADTYMELNDIKNAVFNNWHPYFHTLLIGLFNKTFNDIIYFLYFRLIIYSLLLNSILFYFGKKGLKLKYIYIISIIFTIFPVTSIMLITMIKDSDFIIALVALSYYLYLIINDIKYFNSNKLNYLYLVISMVLVALFRHNGIYIFIVVITALLILSYRRKKFIIFLIPCISSLFVFFVRIPLYNYLKVNDAPRNFDIITMLHGINYLFVNDVSLDKKTYKYITNNVISKDKMDSSYDKYNHDLLLHYSDANIRNKDIDKKKIIQIYLKNLVKHPIYLVKDRLYGTDLIWNVSEKDRVKVYKYQTLYDEFDTNYAKEFGIKTKYKPISKKVNNILLFISNNELLNIISFRAGIYFDILIIIGIYFLINNKKKLYSMIPIIVNILTLFIAMGHQEYRYVWMIEVIALFYILTIRYSDNL